MHSRQIKIDPASLGSGRSTVRVAPSRLQLFLIVVFLAASTLRQADHPLPKQTQAPRSKGEQRDIRHCEKTEIRTLRRVHRQVPASSYAWNTAKVSCCAGVFSARFAQAL